MKKFKTRNSIFIMLLCVFTLLISNIQSNVSFAQSLPANSNVVQANTAPISLASIPQFTNQPYVTVNNNVPFFKDSDYTTQSFEKYSPLDNLGRCGVAYANVGKETMPTVDRGAIGMIKPSGWHTVRYQNVDGQYLYNRCHLIGYQLTAENANERNLITGTRYLNVTGMLPFENMVADYIKETNHHVLYRVTPIFNGNNLVANGVLMEAKSVEDKGRGICFNVFVYNNQPGININYATGDSSAISGYNAAATTTVTAATAVTSTANNSNSAKQTYVLNTNTHKFHKTSCSSVNKMKDSNKKVYTGTREEVINMGYQPCKICNP